MGVICLFIFILFFLDNGFFSKKKFKKVKMNEKTISEINSFNLLFILIEMCPFNYNSVITMSTSPFI